jgi:hypothetical protein
MKDKKSTKRTSSPSWRHQKLYSCVSYRQLPPCFLVAVRLKGCQEFSLNTPCRVYRGVNARVRKRKCHLFSRSITGQPMKRCPSIAVWKVHSTWTCRRKYSRKHVPGRLPCRTMQCHQAVTVFPINICSMRQQHPHHVHSVPIDSFHQ